MLLIKKQLKRFKWLRFVKFYSNSHCKSPIALIKYFIPYKLLKPLLSKHRINKNLSHLLSETITLNEYIHPYDELKYFRESLNEISNFQLFHDPLPRYLHWEDRNSMAHSVESRVPFLDFRLVEFTRSLPLEYLAEIGSPKKILTHALNGILPQKISNRKDKVGFITPEEIWFTKENTNGFIDLLDKYIDGLGFLFKTDEVKKHILKIQKGNLPFSHDYWRLIHMSIWLKGFKIQTIK
jgi:asparagine synthase (glutamine-hydrolysing)